MAPKKGAAERFSKTRFEEIAGKLGYTSGINHHLRRLKAAYSEKCPDSTI